MEIKCTESCMYNKFDGCCHTCPERSECDEACPEDYMKCGQSSFDEKTALAVFESKELATMRMIADICNQRKQLEAQEKELKDKLKESMNQYGIKNYHNDFLKITYVDEGVRSTLDSTRLKKERPDIAEQYTKKNATSAYVKIEVK